MAIVIYNEGTLAELEDALSDETGTIASVIFANGRYVAFVNSA